MTKDKERINRLIRKSEKIVKRTLTQIDCLYEDHAVKKAKTILKELTHPLSKQFLLSSRSGKIIQPIAKTERYRFRDVSCLKKSSLVEINLFMPVGLQTSLRLPDLTSYH